MEELAPYWWFLAAVFGVGGLVVAVLALTKRAQKPIVTLYLLEFPHVGLILGPALLGGDVLRLAAFVLWAACTVELARALRLGGVSLSALKAMVVMTTGALAYWALGSGPQGFGAVAFAYTLVELNDVCAWIAGNSLGKHKLWPALSPNKTWEGTLGGLVGTMAGAYGLGFLVPELSLGAALGAGALLALLGPAGDLLASWVKRRAGIKDYADWIPVHGGILDLYDAFFFAAPAFLLYLHLFGRGPGS